MSEPKETKAWGVYSPNGKLLEVAMKKTEAYIAMDERLARVFVTPIVKK